MRNNSEDHFEIESLKNYHKEMDKELANNLGFKKIPA